MRSEMSANFSADLFRSALTVSELNHYVKCLLESNFPLLWIRGEISNLKCYQSGHWYFTLKDAAAQVRCVMFNHKNRYLDWIPRDGMQVEVLTLVSLYEPRGDFQLNVETMRRAGLGGLYEAFEKLKAKLDRMGLFDVEKKKPLPIYPIQVGIITSPDTAALRDVLTTLQRRMPALPIIIYPTPVQGKVAAGSIVEAIKIANRRAECDVLIVCRGGGSIEDLWAFNEEIVAQAIAVSKIPIVCGIGHEIDFTIADFVADRRAPTPTAAAEMVSPDRQALLQQLNNQRQHLMRAVQHILERAMQRIDLLSYRLVYPGDRLRQQCLQLQLLRNRLVQTWVHRQDKQQWKLRELARRLSAASPTRLQYDRQLREQWVRLRNSHARLLDMKQTRLNHWQMQLAHLNPQSVLERGYSITFTQQGEIVRDSKQLQPSDRIRVKFAQGQTEADVREVHHNNKG